MEESSLCKIAKNSKDYEPAIEAFNKALTEHRNQDTLKKLNDAERAKKDLEQQVYYDPSLADEQREKGEVQFHTKIKAPYLELHGFVQV
jgi:stress-induced-phosphoprotein 1